MGTLQTAPQGAGLVVSIMQVSRQDLNPCTIQLEVECGPEQVSAGIDRAYRNAAKQIRVPGFRPGAAPRHLIDQYVSKEQLRSEAADEVVKHALNQALKEQEITPDDLPAVQVTEFDLEAQKCTFIAKVPLKPSVELGDYKGLGADLPPVEVSDEEVDAQVEEIRKRRGKREAVTDRGAAEGDIAVVNIRVDGETGEGRNFMTIAGKTFPELDAALSGMFAEEMKVLDLPFPETFQEKDWAGKTLRCQVTLRSLNAVHVPSLDDAFAQSLNTQSVDDLRTKVRERLIEAKNQIAHEYVGEQLQEELMRRCKVQVPDTMWEMVAVRRLEDLHRDVTRRGKTLEAYAQENGMTVQELAERWREEARQHVMRAVVIRDIFLAEKMQLSNDDFNIALREMAAEYEMEPGDLYDALKKQKAMRELEYRAIFKKVLAFLHEHASIRQMPAGAMA